MVSKTKEIAEIVGVWLAEGWRKSDREITITNNCFIIIKKSYKVLKHLFGKRNFRIYVYKPYWQCVDTQKIKG